MMRRLRKPLLRRASGSGSSVSVVVVVTDDNAVFLLECLSVLAAQDPAEVLLVVTGTGRDTAALVAGAGAGAELRRIDLPGASVADAFNAGTAEASADRFVLVTAGDRLRQDVLRDLSRPGFDVVGAGPLGFGTRRLRRHVLARCWAEGRGRSLGPLPAPGRRCTCRCARSFSRTSAPRGTATRHWLWVLVRAAPCRTRRAVGLCRTTRCRARRVCRLGAGERGTALPHRCGELHATAVGAAA